MTSNMTSCLNAIENIGSKELEEIISEADNYGVGESVREIWQIDRKRLKDDFDEDQKRNCEKYMYVYSLHDYFTVIKLISQMSVSEVTGGVL